MSSIAPEPGHSCVRIDSRPRIRSEFVASLQSAFCALRRRKATTEDVQALLSRWFTGVEMCTVCDRWDIWGRDDQLPPLATAAGAPWRTWLILGGRGAGKT